MASAKKATTKKAKAPRPGRRLNVELPDEVHRALKVRAAMEGVSVREIVLAALRAAGIE